MRKGHLQLLFETGWIDPADEHPRKSWARDWGKHKPSQKELEEMTNKDGKRISTLYLQSRRDFREEKTIIEKLFFDSGHIVIASPRYHPGVLKWLVMVLKWLGQRKVMLSPLFYMILSILSAPV